MNQAREFQKRRWAILRRLDDHGAAGGERRADLDRRQEELAVPGHDHCDDADRLATQPDIHVRLVDRQIGALDLVGDAGIITIIVGDIGDLRRGLADDLAGVARLQFRKFLRIGSNEIGEPVEELATLRRRRLRPGAFVKRFLGGIDRAVDVSLPRLRHLGPHVACRGIDTLEPSLPVEELTIDEVLEALHGVYSANAGMTSAMKRSSEAFLRSNDIPVSIQKEYSS